MTPTLTTERRPSILSLLPPLEPEPTPAPVSPLLSLADAAEVVPLSEKTLYRVAQSGSGPFRKVERRWMVYEDELHEWVRSHRGEPAERRPAKRPQPRRRGGGMRARVLEAAAE